MACAKHGLNDVDLASGVISSNSKIKGTLLDKEQAESGSLVGWPCFSETKTSPNLSKEEETSILTNSSQQLPFCRICHSVDDSAKHPLIAPCKCSGTMKFIHTACLSRWLQISCKQLFCSIPSCELCGTTYQFNSMLSLRKFHFPTLSTSDKILNFLFIVLLAIMLLCASISTHYLKMSEQQYVYRTHRTSPGLTEAEIIVLISSVLFFIAFLMSLFTQYKAENTMFKSLVQIILTNKNWAIRNYDEGERNVYHASISTSIHNQDRKMLLPEGIQTDIDKEYLIV